MTAIRAWESEPGVYWEVVPKYTAEDWAKRNPIPPSSWVVKVDPAPSVDLDALSVNGWYMYQARQSSKWWMRLWYQFRLWSII